MIASGYDYMLYSVLNSTSVSLNTILLDMYRHTEIYISVAYVKSKGQSPVVPHSVF